jgi:hypothetical protein
MASPNFPCLRGPSHGAVVVAAAGAAAAVPLPMLLPSMLLPLGFHFLLHSRRRVVDAVGPCRAPGLVTKEQSWSAASPSQCRWTF